MRPIMRRTMHYKRIIITLQLSCSTLPLRKKITKIKKLNNIAIHLYKASTDQEIELQLLVET